MDLSDIKSYLRSKCFSVTYFSTKWVKATKRIALNNSKLGSDCGSVGRAVPSDTRRPR